MLRNTFVSTIDERTDFIDEIHLLREKENGTPHGTQSGTVFAPKKVYGKMSTSARLVEGNTK